MSDRTWDFILSAAALGVFAMIVAVGIAAVWGAA